MGSVKRRRVLKQRRERGMMHIGKKWKRPNMSVAFWDGDTPADDTDFVPWGYATNFKIEADCPVDSERFRKRLTQIGMQFGADLNWDAIKLLWPVSCKEEQTT